MPGGQLLDVAAGGPAKLLGVDVGGPAGDREAPRPVSLATQAPASPRATPRGSYRRPAPYPWLHTTQSPPMSPPEDDETLTCPWVVQSGDPAAAHATTPRGTPGRPEDPSGRVCRRETDSAWHPPLVGVLGRRLRHGSACVAPTVRARQAGGRSGARQPSAGRQTSLRATRRPAQALTPPAPPLLRATVATSGPPCPPPGPAGRGGPARVRRATLRARSSPGWSQPSAARCFGPNVLEPKQLRSMSYIIAP